MRFHPKSAAGIAGRVWGLGCCSLALALVLSAGCLDSQHCSQWLIYVLKKWADTSSEDLHNSVEGLWCA